MACDFVITTDRSMMTDHHKLEFIGFMTTGPAYGMPEAIWNWICMPRMKTNEEGGVKEAPYGLRKIEAALIDAGFKAMVVDPDRVGKYVDSAKAILIGHHDYFALGPPSNQWRIITKKEPVNAKSFKRFMESEAMKKARKKGVKTIVGGPAAWQWLWMPELIDRWKINTIIDGEAEKVIVDIARRIVDEKPLPLYMYVGPKDSPKLEEIPSIKAPSVNGLIEIMRGCPRNCKFCSVTLRPLRCYTFDMIKKELEVNKKAGITGGIIHSEDVLLYGAKGVKPEPDPLIKLHKLVKKYYRNLAWSHCSLAAVKYAEDNYKLISTLAEMIKQDQDYMGVEVGIETGSPRLVRKIMPAKPAPYSVESWPELVEDSFRILHENTIIPAATLIVGLPEETEGDIVKTTELVEKLRPYRSLIIPMYFVPMGFFKDKRWYRKEYMEDAYRELAIACLRHCFYWADEIMSKFYIKGFRMLPVKILLKLLLATYRKKARI